MKEVAVEKVVYDTLKVIDTVAVFFPFVIPFAEGSAEIDNKYLPILDDFLRILSKYKE